MIDAVVKTQNGKKIWVMSLTREHIKSLEDGENIYIQGHDGIENNVLIFFKENEDLANKEIRRQIYAVAEAETQNVETRISNTLQ